MVYNKLRGRIVEKYGTMKKFAEEVGISRQALSQKLRGRIKFTMNDIQRYVTLLDIPKDEIGLFFFE